MKMIWCDQDLWISNGEVHGDQRKIDRIFEGLYIRQKNWNIVVYKVN